MRLTKEDIIREVDSRLIKCSCVVTDGVILNKINKIQSDIQYYSYTQLGMLLDALEEFDQDRPDTIAMLLDVAGNIKR